MIFGRFRHLSRRKIKWRYNNSKRTIALARIYFDTSTRMILSLTKLETIRRNEEKSWTESGIKTSDGRFSPRATYLRMKS